jgi:protein TonB
VKSAQRELAERLAEAASRARPVADGAKPAATLAAAATAPAPAAPEPQMPAPLPADAAHQATPTPTTPQAGPDVVAAGTLARVRYVEPVYPRTARVRGAGGWVEMQFTVRPDGTVGDVVVTQAEPAGVFDDAAAAAVRQWRYRPVLRDGQAVEQRARVRVRFAVE